MCYNSTTPTQHKSAEGAEGFDYKWLAYSKNKMSMFLIQNGYLNGLKENPPSLSPPQYFKEPIHLDKYKDWNTMEGGLPINFLV